MSKTKIAILLSSQGKNKELANTIKNHLIDTYPVNVEIIDLVELQLPLYSQLQHDQTGVPSALQSLHQTLDAVDGFIITAPEYNGGIPPVLTNVIAWLSVKSSDWRQVFNTKPAGIATHSGGLGANLIATLRIQLAYIGLTLIGIPIQVTSFKPLNMDDLNLFSDQLIKLSNATNQ